MQSAGLLDKRGNDFSEPPPTDGRRKSCLRLEDFFLEISVGRSLA
jgi:hypothetical protein